MALNLVISSSVDNSDNSASLPKEIDELTPRSAVSTFALSGANKSIKNGR
jgi:hypothetical protein